MRPDRMRGPRLSRWLWLPALIGLGLLALPLLALVLRAPWAAMPRLLADPALVQALLLSLGTATAATALSLLLGVPLALILARSVEWSAMPRRLLRAVVLLPLVLPPVVGGVALLLLLGRRGVLGGSLDAWWGISIPFSTAAVVIAQTFVAMPFLVLSVEGVVRGLDQRYELMAASLGASRWTVFRRVTLPMTAPGIAAGAALCFARALGEFGATITFAGSFPGVTQTLPIAIYLQLQSNPEAAIALSLVLMAVAVIVLLGLRDRWSPGLTG